MPDKIEYKQVVVINDKQKFRTGEIASLTAKTAMLFLVSEDPKESEFSRAAADGDFSAWMNFDMPIEVKKAEDARALDSLIELAHDAGLRVRSFSANTYGTNLLRGVKVGDTSSLCIGPNDSALIDNITGKLKLL